MKRILCILLMALAGFSAWGQKRVYLHKDEFRDDVYVIENNDGEVTAFVELEVLSRFDSLFLVINKSNIDDVRSYMTELRDTYDAWSNIAKKNKVKNVKKSFSVESPEVQLRWAEQVKDSYSRFPVLRMKERFSTKDKWLTPDFIITENGHALISFDLRLKDTSGNPYHARFFLSRREINHIIKWLDYDNLMRTYNKKKPKLTDQEIQALFQ